MDDQQYHSHTVHDPRHFIDEYVVEAPRVVLLEAVYHELHVVHVEVLYSRAGAVKDHCHLLVGFFPGDNWKRWSWSGIAHELYIIDPLSKSCEIPTCAGSSGSIPKHCEL